jgi:Arc/MetJ-type ribon-helix-helix transcriptional regulator
MKPTIGEDGVPVSTRVSPAVVALMNEAVEKGHFPTKSALLQTALLAFLEEHGADWREGHKANLARRRLSDLLAAEPPPAPKRVAEALQIKMAAWQASGDLTGAERWRAEVMARLEAQGMYGRRILHLCPWLVPPMAEA